MPTLAGWSFGIGVWLPGWGWGVLDFQNSLLLLGLAMVTISLMMRARKRRMRQEPPLTAREQVERMKQARGMRGDLEELMVEIEQLAKRFGAQLDAKTMQLEQMLRDAESMVARLEELRRTTSGARGNAHAGEAEGAATSQAPGDKPVLEGAGEVDPVQSTGAADDPADPVARSVYELADQGLDAAQIARRLNEHVGKVELILALRNAG